MDDDKEVQPERRRSTDAYFAAEMLAVTKELAELRGTLGTFISHFQSSEDHWQKAFDALEKRVGPPRLGAILGAAATVVAVTATVLISIGNLALAPLATNQTALAEVVKQIRMEAAESRNRNKTELALADERHRQSDLDFQDRFVGHIQDGHPKSVRDDIERVNARLSDEINRLVRRQNSIEDMDQQHAQRIQALETKVDERTKYFEDLLDARASDRWTKSQAQVYQQGHEMRHSMEREHVMHLQNMVDKGRAGEE